MKLLWARGTVCAQKKRSPLVQRAGILIGAPAFADLKMSPPVLRTLILEKVDAQINASEAKSPRALGYLNSYVVTANVWHLFPGCVKKRVSKSQRMAARANCKKIQSVKVVGANGIAKPAPVKNVVLALMMADVVTRTMTNIVTLTIMTADVVTRTMTNIVTLTMTNIVTLTVRNSSFHSKCVSYNFRLRIYLPLQPATNTSGVGVVSQQSTLNQSVVMAMGNPIDMENNVTTGEYAYWCTEI